MALLDTITEGIQKIIPAKQSKPSTSISGGIGSGHGMVLSEDDMIVPKTTIVCHASQIFFNFLAMACFASVAAFQAKWKVGPSGLSGFTIFLTISGMLLSLFMLLIPVGYEKYDKFVRLARALKEVRVGFILTGTGTTLSLLLAFITTISAFTQPGCKDKNKDPHAGDRDDGFKDGLPGWCSTKKAGAVFLWLAFVFWAASLVFLIISWRQGKLHGGPRDPPFKPPQETYELPEDEEEPDYHVIPPARRRASDEEAGHNPFSDNNRYNAGANAPSSTYNMPSRPSMDAYGAFSDPEPSGFGQPARTGFASPPVLPEPDLGPKVSRTMQYADPYAAVRANLASGNQSSNPPRYEGYQDYRS